MKWKNIPPTDSSKVFITGDEVEIESFKDKHEYKSLVKKYHPDTSDPFFRKLNTKRLQILNRIKDEKDG